jgi:lipoate-protein ligase A
MVRADNRRHWRFIACSGHDGFTNMAIDEAIMESYIGGDVPPTLRLYIFSPPAMTIGLSQKLAPDVVAEIEKQGIDVVKRPTGGRAVLHLNDLTYSFIGGDTTRENGFLSTSVTTSYKQICQGLIATLAALGVEAELGASGVAYRHLQDCFMATTGSDLQHNGTKLIGSAQMRRRGAVLQHGSLPLNQDPTLMSRLLGEPEQAELRHHNLFDISARKIELAEMEDAFLKGFANAFGITFETAGLTECETKMATERSSSYRLPQLTQLT